MNKPEITVCIPVYNVENYIEQCLESVFSQTYIDKTEVIIVDDCSPDNSISVANDVISKFSNLKDRIKIIHHSKNKGLAAARNTGLLNSSGKYLIQVDSDDWLETDYLEKLYTAAEQSDADITGCDYFLEFSDRTVIEKETAAVSNVDYLKSMLRNAHGTIWTKLVRRSLFTANGIQWVEGLDMGEDLLICTKLFANAKRIGHIPIPLYHYRRNNPNSFCNDEAKASYKIESLTSVVENITEYLKRWTPVYDNEFYYLKARIKFICLFMGNHNLRMKTYKLYPECDKFLKYVENSTKRKILVFFVSHKLYLLSEFLFLCGGR